MVAFMSRDNKRIGPDRRSVLKALGITGATALAGCTGGEDEGSTEDTEGQSGGGGGEEDTETPEPDDKLGGHWVAPQGSDAPNVNPFLTTDTTSSARIYRAMDPAYNLDRNDEFIPRLFRDYEPNDDFTEWTFKITENGEWSDPYGELTADDFVWSIKNVIQGGEYDENWAGASSYDRFHTEDGEPFGVEATGTYELQISFPTPDPAFLHKPVMWGFQEVMPRDIIEPYYENRDQEGFQQAEEINEFQYTGNLGPFKLETLETESRAYYVRNDDYYLRQEGSDQLHDSYEDTPTFDEWTYEVIREESTRLSALQADEVTTAGIPSRRAEEFIDMDDIQVVETPTVYCLSLFWNMRAGSPMMGERFEHPGWEALVEPKVRRALMMSIDKQQIVDGIYEGWAQAAHTLQPHYSQFYDDTHVDEIGVGASHDKEQARQLLEDNLPDPYGYNGDGRIVDGDGEQVVLKMVFSDSSEAYKTMTRYISQEWDELGLDVVLEDVPWNTLINEYTYESLGADRDWDIITGFARNSYPRAPESTQHYWAPNGSANFYGYADPHDIAGKMEESQQMTDQQERQEALAEVFGILNRDQVYGFLQFGTNTTGYQDYVNFTSDPDEASDHLAFGVDNHNWWFDDAHR